jgi:predicted Zn finger-like uncharacterized protein
MSLATRCPKCNTVFQVNEEQLKRYSGVVRCGVCHNPFNGIDHLIGRLSRSEPDSARPKAENISSSAVSSDIARIKPEERGKTRSRETSSSNLEPFSKEINEDDGYTAANEALKAQEAALKESFEKQIQSISFDLNVSSLDVDKPESALPASEITLAGDVTGNPAKSMSSHADIGKKEPFLPSDPAKDDIAPAIIVDVPEQGTEKPVSAEELAKIVEKKKKRSRFSQFLWGIGSLLLLALAGLQGIYHYSEEITAWWPPSEELVNTTCELLSCPVKVPVKKPVLSIETTAPEKLENLANQYTQNITMSNNSPNLQIWPALVMELTDFDNKVLLRRTFQPEEYLPEEAGTAKGLAPESGITFKMTFEFAHNSAVKSRVFFLNNP